jgi:branched-chain amino acid transport system permease protein
MSIIIIGISVGSIYGLLALGVNLVFKTTRVLNLSLAEMGTFATYLAWQFVDQWGWPWAVGAPLAIAIVTGIGLLFERFVIRPNIDAPRLALVIATVGLGLLLYGLEIGIWGLSPQFLTSPLGNRGPDVFGVNIHPLRLLALILNVAIGLGLMMLLRRTTFGLGVLASAHDPVTIRLMGIRQSRISMFAWGGAAALAALTGLILLPAIGTFIPLDMTLKFPRILAASLLGGLTSLPGAFVGGLSIGVMEAFLQDQFPAASGEVELALFAVVLAVIMLRPRGLLGSEA